MTNEAYQRVRTAYHIMQGDYMIGSEDRFIASAIEWLARSFYLEIWRQEDGVCAKCEGATPATSVVADTLIAALAGLIIKVSEINGTA